MRLPSEQAGTTTSASPHANPRYLGPWLDGDDVPSVYDAWCDSLESLDTEATVAELAELAAGGPVLELAIGTGRIALPLLRRGLEVHGVDSSEEMVAKLREKPGGNEIPVTIGDLVDVPVAGRFKLIFVVFNTFFGLGSAEEQRRCFRAVADHLYGDGAFVIEVALPNLGRFSDGARAIRHFDMKDVTLVDVATHDPGRQRLEHEHIVMRPGGVSVVPISIQYAFPAQLDEMAGEAGLRLSERWGNWRRGPYDGDHAPFVSVYRPAQKDEAGAQARAAGI